MTGKILFLHGWASSGSYKLADTLRILLKPEAVIAPDLPPDPDEALTMARALCEQERPVLAVGMSWGGFLLQQVRGQRKALINPDFRISRFLRTMIGEVGYLSPRRDGQTSLLLSEAMCDRYAELEAEQFAGIDPAEQALTLGFFAQNDELTRCGDIFEEHYPGRGISYPGGHLPTFPEVKRSIAPVLQEWLLQGDGKLGKNP